MEHDMHHMDYLEAVAGADVAHLREKEKTYKGSWKRRGGVGAFMMLARKWDRLEGMLGNDAYHHQYDIFDHIQDSPGGEDGSVLAEIRDLRRYLLLVEAEMVARGTVKHPLAPPVMRPGGIGGERIVLERKEAPPVPGSSRPGYLYATKGEDSNRHARQEYLMDGWTPGEYNDRALPWVGVPGTDKMAIINRPVVADKTRIDHLPRLPVELNHQEWKESPIEYRWMYDWTGEKHVMEDILRECWGKQ